MGRWVTIKGRRVFISDSGAAASPPDLPPGRHPSTVYGSPSAPADASFTAELADAMLLGRLRKGDRREWLHAISNKGEMLFTDVGSDHRVISKKSQYEKIRGGILTHTHPSGSSFSQGDVRAAQVYELAEMRAVTVDGVFKLGPPTGGWGSVTTNLAEEYGPIAGYTNANMTRLAEKYGLYYEFKPWP